MLCKEVKRVVYFFLDGTLDEKRKRDFTKHLKHCPECESRITISKRIRIFIKKRLARMSAPARLKQRLSRSLRAFAD
ncbi:MAG TPA: zf-HC2 domain-containing protein [Thermoanaerobaculia bacterium]|nr:zf-HC2 domain-containing protein [Thermoanaerobaculia bacterium]